METKENNYKSVFKSTIFIFLCYTILITFIFIVLVIGMKKALYNVQSLSLSVVLSLICGIFIFHIFHFICRSSNIESLKKEKMDSDNVKKFTTRMHLFFLICCIFSALICIGYLFMDRCIFMQTIEKAHRQYDFISLEFANQIENYILIEYEDLFLQKIFSTIIIEISLVVSFLSLIPYQEKLLKKFNKN